MPRRAHHAFTILLLAGAGCRTYEAYPKITQQKGLVPAAQFAQYGREQAAQVAIGREFAAAYAGDSPEALARQTAAAVAYARTLPEVADVVPDTLGHRLTVRFKSGWRAAVVPIPDGRRGADTPGIQTGAGAAK